MNHASTPQPAYITELRNLRGGRLTKINGITTSLAPLAVAVVTAMASGGAMAQYVQVNSTSAPAYANGSESIAIGSNAIANGSAAVAIGQNSEAAADHSTAVGSNAVATGLYSTAFGLGARAHSEAAVAIGFKPLVDSNSLRSTAIGWVAEVMNSVDSTAIGTEVRVENSTAAIAIGSKNTATNEVTKVINAEASIAIGRGAQVDVEQGIAIGDNAIVNSPTSIAIGANAKVSAGLSSAVALGANSEAAANTNSAYLVSARNAGNGAVSIGQAGQERQIQNVAPGLNNTDAVNVEQLKAVAGAALTTSSASGGTSTNGGTFVNATIANGTGVYASATAYGESSIAGADKTSAFGTKAQASSFGATALGFDTKASGAGGTAIGYQAQAKGTDSVAIGYAIADNASSVAIGRSASASASQATALGFSSDASGLNSIALGDATASGTRSIAVGDTAGFNNTGNDSISLGYAAGRNNVGDNNIAIGFRANNDIATAKSNAIAIGTYASAGDNAVALGVNSNASKIDAIAVGNGSQATVAYAAAIGRLSSANAEGAVALGNNSSASITNSVAVGSFSQTSVAGAAGTEFLTANAAVAATNSTTTSTGTLGVISIGGLVGGVNYNRQIQNVAAGTKDDDAANVAQVKAVATGAMTTSSASGATFGQTGFVNASIDRAAGTGTGVANAATAFGESAKANTDSSTAFGTGATAGTTTGVVTQIQSTAIGAGSSATGGQATAVGNGASANWGAVAIGKGAFAPSRGVAIGEIANASGDISMALGSSSQATAFGAIALNTGGGAGDGALGNYAIAVGRGATASANDTTSIGRDSTASASDAISIGRLSNAVGTGSIALGNGAGSTVAGSNQNVAIGVSAGTNVNGNNNTTMGLNSGQNVTGSDNITGGNGGGRAVTGSNNVAFGANTGNNIAGNNNVALGPNALNNTTGSSNIALGLNANSNASATSLNDTIALGTNSDALKNNAVALGNTAIANKAGDVALGSGSVTSTSAVVPVASITFMSATAGNVAFAGGTSGVVSTVSVGAAGAERMITNVAAGSLSATSTDAVNGSQLFGVTKVIDDKMDAQGAVLAGALGGGSIYTAATNVLTAPNYLSNLGNSTSLTGASTTAAVNSVSGAVGRLDAAIGALSASTANNNQIAQWAFNNSQASNMVANPISGAVGSVHSTDPSFTPPRNHGSVGSTAFGGGADTGKGENSTAIGSDASTGFAANPAGAVVNGATAIGTSTKAGGENSTALGFNATATGEGSSALGSSARAEGAYSTAVGMNASAYGEAAVALGHKAEAANRSTALGTSAKAYGEDSLALGRDAVVRDTDIVTGFALMGGTAIGQGAFVEHSNAVSIGTFSTSAVNNSDSGNTAGAGGSAFLVKAQNTGFGAVSVGGTTDVNTGEIITRQIKNLAPGYDKTDAVNVEQLSVVNDVANQAVNMAANAQATASSVGFTTAAALGGGSTFNGSVVTAPNYVSNLAQANAITGASTTTAVNTVAGAITRLDTALGTVNTTVDTRVDNLGKQVSTALIGNDTLYTPATNTLAAPSFNLPNASAGGAAYTNTKDALIALDTKNAAQDTAINNLTTGASANTPFTIVGTEIKLSTSGAPATKVNLAGTAGDVTVTGVKNGVAANDAVNFSQLDAVKTTADAAKSTADTTAATVNNATTGLAATKAIADNANNNLANAATALGGGAMYNPSTGTWTAPSYTVNGAAVNNVGAALTALDGVNTTQNTNISNLQTTVNNITNGSSANTPFTIVGTEIKLSTSGAPATKVNLAGTAGDVTLTGVKNGVAANDAVNFSQLTAAASTAEASTDALGAKTAAALGGSYNAPTNTVTVAYNLANASGGGAAYTDVGSALTALDSKNATQDTKISTIEGNITNLSNGTTGVFVKDGASNSVVVNTGIVTDPTTKINFGDRTVTGVKAGTAGLDAVNFTQLSATNAGVNSLATQLGGTYNSTTGAITNMPTYNVGGTTYTTIGGAVGAVSTTVNNLTQTVNNIAGPTLSNGGNANTPFKTDGTTITVATAGSTATTLNLANSNTANAGGTMVVTGVANGAVGANSTDAVNGSQLFAIQSNLTQAITTATGTASGQAAFTQNATNGVVSVNSTLTTAATAVNMGNLAVTGVKAVTLTANGTEAVNASQLFDTNQKLSALTSSSNARLDGLDSSVNKLTDLVGSNAKKAAAGTAMAIASIQAISGAPEAGTAQLGIGLGHQDGQTGMAIGVNATSESGRVGFSASIGAGTAKAKPSFGAGIRWKF